MATPVVETTTRQPAKAVDQVTRRVHQLRQLRAARTTEMEVMRDVMDNNGVERLLDLVGDRNAFSAPVANYALSGLTRLGQKLGRMPSTRVDPPRHKEGEQATKRAEKVERIVESYDEANKLRLLLPQNGLWLPGYGFTTWVIRERQTPDGYYPKVELRDPFGAYPGEFRTGDQPADCAFVYRIPIHELKARYPHYANLLNQRAGGGVLLEPSDYPQSYASSMSSGAGWGNQSGSGVEIAEYYCAEGMYCVALERNLLLEWYPNPLKSGMQVVVMRRVTFNKATGQYDAALGLQSAMARLNQLVIVALEEGINAPTDISGEVISHGGQYRRGYRQINKLAPGTTVNMPVPQLNPQVLQEARRMELQFRQMAGYSEADDGQSPANMAATGAGLQQLALGVDLGVRQDLMVIGDCLELVDHKLLEWDENAYGDTMKPLVGMHRGQPFSETYSPSVHIKGHRRTRRTYGAMAGIDDSRRIVGLLQLLQAELIDEDTAREQIDGLNDLTKIKDRVQAKRVEGFLFGAMTSGQPVDPRVAMTLIELLPESETKEVLRKFWTPQEPQMSPEEEMMAQGPQPAAPAGPAGPPPDIATVMSRLTEAGGAGSVQTVGRLQGRAA